MSSTGLAPPSPDHALLTPNTLNEAEAAFNYNASLQSSSAGRPQPTTPLAPASNNYLAAAAEAGIPVTAIPHPPAGLPRDESTASHDSVDSSAAAAAAAAPPLSRGTTAAVLAKMSSGEYDFADSELGRRGSRDAALHRLSAGTAGPRDAHADVADDPKPPPVDRRQSWTQEDLKHSVMLVQQQRFAGDAESPADKYGYSNQSGTPMYTG